MLTLHASAVLLTDPFLQLPTETTVRVVWFTEFAGTKHLVLCGEDIDQIDLSDYSLEDVADIACLASIDIRVTSATSTKLSRMREDQESHLTVGAVHTAPSYRDIWRHEAIVEGLTPGVRVPYYVVSLREDRQMAVSASFTLSPVPSPGTALKILLTSDHQVKPLTAANMQKVVETVGRVDAVFMAGDHVEVPDRASEWFDDQRGSAFFPVMQGRAHVLSEKGGVTTLYAGGPILQFAPLYSVVGNHDVMGHFSMEHSLNRQFHEPYPRPVAEMQYDAVEAHTQDSTVARAAWVADHSFNVHSYKELFRLPTPEHSDLQCYAVTFGDIRLVALHTARVWRTPQLVPHDCGKYHERENSLDTPEKWGWGDFIYEPISAGSVQYAWLVKQLTSSAFQSARYRIVMLHHPLHSLGQGIVPAFTDPQQHIERDADNNITAVRYEYPKHDDYLIRDIEPLLSAAGVHLVFYGHSHVWNRFKGPTGVQFLESSNVGGSHGAFVKSGRRFTAPPYDAEDYAAVDDPYALEPSVPTLQPLLDEYDLPLPYLASNDITAFSIFDTGTGTVSSYYFDTRTPSSSVIKFDEFSIVQLRHPPEA